MKAEERFNKLGWKRKGTDPLNYERIGQYGSFDMIVFNKSGGFGYLSYNEEGKESGLVYFSEELLEAINEQLEELAIERLKGELKCY